MNNDFDWSLLQDAEVEQRMDEIIESLKPHIEDDEKKLALPNEARLKQLEFTYLVMRYLTQGADAEVTYKVFEPFKTDGSVSVEGKCLEFNDSKRFARAAEFANNVEVYPLLKDMVRLTFTFDGLATLV